MTDNNTLDSTDLEVIMIDGIDQVAISKADFNSVFLYFQKTGKEFVKYRPGRGGKVQYVEGWYIKQILNLATKFKWSSFIDGMKESSGSVIVWGRIVIELDGKEYTQSSFGDADIKYKKDKPTEPVSIGDDYKAAFTDMIKKAASNWGIASDVYGKRYTEQ